MDINYNSNRENATLIVSGQSYDIVIEPEASIGYKYRVAYQSGPKAQSTVIIRGYSHTRENAKTIIEGAVQLFTQNASS